MPGKDGQLYMAQILQEWDNTVSANVTLSIRETSGIFFTLSAHHSFSRSQLAVLRKELSLSWSPDGHSDVRLMPRHTPLIAGPCKRFPTKCIYSLSTR